MRKRVFGRRFKRDSKDRKALFRSLMRELVLHGSIKTTEAKAKAIRGQIEKYITKVKRESEKASYHLRKEFSPDVVKKMVTVIAPQFAQRPGGYVRILRLGTRTKDNASMVMMQWTEIIEEPKQNIEEKATGVKKLLPKAAAKQEQTIKPEKEKKTKTSQKKGKNEKTNRTNKAK